MLTVKKCWNTTAYKRNLQTVVFLQPRCHPWEQGWGVPVFANLCSEPGGRGRLGREDHPVCTLDSCCYPGGPPGGGASLDPQLVNPVDSFIELDVQKNFHPALEPKNFFTLVTYYYLRVLVSSFRRFLIKLNLQRTTLPGIDQQYPKPPAPTKLS